MKSLKKNLVTLLILLIGTTTLTAQSKAQGLQDLVGAKGSSAEMDLQNRGYHHIKTSKSGYNIYSYWWNSSDKKCVSYRLSDGRVVSIVNTLPFDCNKTTDNNASNYYNGNGYYSHQAHHHATNNYSHYDNTDLENAFERGHVDGLHNAPYHNIYSSSNQKTSYGDGYASGMEQRKSNISHHSGYGGYQAYVEVSDLTNWEGARAYTKLNARGFTEEKSYMDDGRLIKVWYNSKTRQCIKTIAKHDIVVKIKTTSDQCRK